MIVCICKNVNNRQIQEALDRGVTSLEHLEQETGLGSCCGKCRFVANRIINEQGSVVQQYQPTRTSA